MMRFMDLVIIDQEREEKNEMYNFIKQKKRIIILRKRI